MLAVAPNYRSRTLPGRHSMRGACHAKVNPFRADTGKEVSISAGSHVTFRRARTFLTTLREDLFKADQARLSPIIELPLERPLFKFCCFKQRRRCRAKARSR